MAKKGSSFWDNPFGGLFDFNRDGKESSFEQYFAYRLIDQCRKDEEERRRIECEEDEKRWKNLYAGYHTAPKVVTDPAPVTINIEVHIPGFDALNAIKRSDYPNERKYLAAYHLCDIQQGTAYISEDTTPEQEIDRCEFILNSGTIAANFLSVFDGFLYTQAVSEYFCLPIEAPEEDTRPLTYFPSFFRDIVKADPELAVKVWKWCIQEFGPYSQYMKYPDTLYAFLMCSESEYPDSFLDIASREIGTDPAFCNGLLLESPGFPHCSGPFIARALRNGLSVEAARMFISAIGHPGRDSNALEELINAILYHCKDYQDLIAMEAFKQYLYPLLEYIPNERIQQLLPEYRDSIDRYIRYIESSCAKYQYSRRFSWRKKHKDSTGLGVDPLDYESEDDFLEALQEAKYGWRDWAIYEAKEFGLDPYVYETEAEFNAAYEDAYNRAFQKRRESETRFLKKQEELTARKQAEARLAETDTTPYTFCSVEFQKGGKRYQYRTDDDTLSSGDLVVVPVGRDKKEVVATVVSIEKYLRKNAPFPVDSTKFVLRKHQ